MSAGRGLAAAHRAGLVHRDFKPENVLVGVDGRVRVVDFGIALTPDPDRPHDRSAASTAEPRDPRVARPSARESDGDDARDTAWDRASARLTRTGAMLGTPAYMAPEQHLGLAVDERSDQFSFCMTLHEALFRELPFEGSSLPALAMNVTRGRLREPPAGAVPAWLRRVLARGLALDPVDRYPSMDALLAELAREPEARHTRRLALGVGVAAAAILAGWVAISATTPCEDVDRHLEGVWDGGTRDAIARAFERTGLAFAERSRATSVASLDAYATQWLQMRREACEATHVHGEQSADMLDRRMACLDGRLRRFAALATVLAEADADVVGRSVEATLALPAIEPCADAEALLGAHAITPDGAAIDTLMAQGEALRAAGKLGQARAVTADTLARAQAAEVPDLEARAHRLEGKLALDEGRYDDAERSLLAGLAAAERGGADPERAELLLDLGYVIGEGKQRHDEALSWLQLAGAVIDRTHGSAVQRAELELDLGLVAGREGRFADSVARLEQALESWRAAPGERSLDIARTHNALGATLDARGQHDAALEHYREALALLEGSLGGEHPNVAIALNNVAIALKALGRLDDARAAHERAITIRRATLGPDHPKLAASLMNLGNVLVAQGHHEEAIAYFEEALAIQDETPGPSDPTVGKTNYNLGVALHLSGRHAEALARYERALAIDGAALGEDDPELAYPRAGIGTVLVELGRAREAIAPLEAALATRSSGEASPLDLGEIRFALARAYHAEGRGDARPVAEQAAADYRRGGDEAMARRVEAFVTAL